MVKESFNTLHSSANSLSWSYLLTVLTLISVPFSSNLFLV